jgi:hypothetical protein
MPTPSNPDGNVQLSATTKHRSKANKHMQGREKKTNHKNVDTKRGSF